MNSVVVCELIFDYVVFGADDFEALVVCRRVCRHWNTLLRRDFDPLLRVCRFLAILRLLRAKRELPSPIHDAILAPFMAAVATQSLLCPRRDFRYWPAFARRYGVDDVSNTKQSRIVSHTSVRRSFKTTALCDYAAALFLAVPNVSIVCTSINLIGATVLLRRIFETIRPRIRRHFNGRDYYFGTDFGYIRCSNNDKRVISVISPQHLADRTQYPEQCDAVFVDEFHLIDEFHLTGGVDAIPATTGVQLRLGSVVDVITPVYPIISAINQIVTNE